MTQTTELPATSLAPAHATVNLDEPLWQKLLAGGVLAGVFFFAAKKLLHQYRSQHT